ncbi:MAG: hypothetical protein ACYC9O_15305, partial [Candidatus Latescibacterota bacterium]
YVAGLTRGIKRIRVDGQNRVWTNPTWLGFTDSGYGEYEMFCLENSEWKRVSFRYLAGTISPLVFIPDESYTVWVGGGGGMYRLAESHIEPYIITDNPPRRNFFETIIADNVNNMWFVNEGSVFNFDGAVWRDHTSSIKQLTSQASNPLYFSAIVVDRNNVKWIPCRPQGIYSYDGTAWSLHTTEDGIDLRMFIDLPVHKKDLQNVLWFSSVTQGVISFDGKRWRRYTVADGLASTYIYNMAVDKNNVKWFATEEGLSRFDGKTWKTYTDAQSVQRTNYHLLRNFLLG